MTRVQQANDARNREGVVIGYKLSCLNVVNKNHRVGVEFRFTFLVFDRGDWPRVGEAWGEAVVNARIRRPQSRGAISPHLV